ncbi:MAG: hypothetical protein HYY16_01320 [Planctomycetes bacterium]|nr:hypothetical protein [Planctomycetota bacterium]
MSFPIPDAVLAGETTYFWRVIAVNSSGQTVATNTPFSFTTLPAPRWARSFGGTANDEAFATVPTADGGYLVTGYTSSFSGSPTSDAWILKLNADGSPTWQKRYGGPEVNDQFRSVQVLNDGSFITVGSTDMDVTGDVWVVKLNANGSIVWQKMYGGPAGDYGADIHQTSDGGYIVGATTGSFGPATVFNVWILKLDATGEIVWQKTYGGAGDDYLHSVQQTPDGEYVVAGFSNSFSSSQDAWIFKLNADGTMAWQRAYGPSGTNSERATAIAVNDDGTSVVAGYTSVSGGSLYAWALKLNADGTAAWHRSYSGGVADYAKFITPTGDGGYIMAGETYSFGNGQFDAWILNLTPDGSVDWQRVYGGSASDFASFVHPTADGGYAVAGMTSSFGAQGPYDMWILKVPSNGTLAPLDGNAGATVTTLATTLTNTTAISGDSLATVTPTSVSPVDTNVSGQQQAP